MSVIRNILNSTKLLVNNSLPTTGSNTFRGTQTLSGSILPATDNVYDLGSATYQWKDIYVSSGSLYIDGTKVLSSTNQELQITTDNGQSIKILEAGSDSIILQSADGDIQLKTSGGGNLLFDPTAGLIDVRGTLQIQDGNKITSSGGNSIQFGNDLGITGSLSTTGNINGINLSTYSSSVDSRILTEKGRVDAILLASDADKDSFAEIVSLINAVDTSNDSTFASFYTGSVNRLNNLESTSGSVNTSVNNLNTFSSSVETKNSTLATYTGSVNSQLTSLINATSSYETRGRSIVSGSSQITLSSTTGYGSVLNQAVLTTSSPTFASGTFTSNSGITVGSNGRAFIRQTVGGDAEIGAPTNGVLSLFSNGSSVLSFTGAGAATLANNLQLGSIGGGSSTATPTNINLTSTFSNTAGSNLKLKLFEDTGGNTYGIGVSNSQMDFNIPSGASYRFYTGAATFASSVTTSGAKPQLYVSGNSSNGSGIHLTTSLSGANRRNWGIFTEEVVDGDFVIKCSTAAGGSPGSGNTRLQILNSGTVQPGGNGTQDLGSATNRWSTVYTSDLSLNNGIGDWTIVEGEDDLFLYNNKKGKVYKFALTEVDPNVATPKKS
jgi:hypothetical protein